MDNLSSKKSKFKLKNFLIAMFVLMIGIGAYSVYTSGYTIEDGVVMKDADNAKRNGLLKNLKDKKDTEKIIVNTKSFKDIKEQAKKADKVYKSDDTYVLEFNSEEEKESIEKELNKKDVNIEKSYELKVSENEQKTTSEKTDETSSNEVWTDNKISDVIKKNKVTVAVIDSGLNISDVEKSRIVGGYSFTDSDWKTDENGHGTDITKVILSNTFDNVSVMPLKIVGKDGTTNLESLLFAMRKAIDEQVNVINISLSGEGESKLLENLINEATSKNIIVNVAAGNDGSDENKFFPANIKSAIAVGSLDKDNNIASFSNHGSDVDIYVNGVNVQVEEAEVSGTSMSTALVSSYAAMLKGYMSTMDRDMALEILKNNNLDTDDKASYINWNTNVLDYLKTEYNWKKLDLSSADKKELEQRLKVSAKNYSYTFHFNINYDKLITSDAGYYYVHDASVKNNSKKDVANNLLYYKSNPSCVTCGVTPFTFTTTSNNTAHWSFTVSGNFRSHTPYVHIWGNTTTGYTLGRITDSVDNMYTVSLSGEDLSKGVVNRVVDCGIYKGSWWNRDKDTNWNYYLRSNNSTDTINLIFSPNKYPVTYNGNGGTYNGAKTWSENATYNQDYYTQSNNNFFTRTDYEFIGWNEKADGTGTDWTNYIGKPWKYQYTTGVTLYAQWKRVNYNITYDGNGGTYNGAKTWSEKVAYNSQYKTWKNFFDRPGFTFIGWNEKKDGTGVDWTDYIDKEWKWTYTDDVTLYAQWKMNDSYSITYDTNGGSIPSKSSTSNYKIIPNGEYLIRSTLGSGSRYIHAEWDGYYNFGPTLCLYDSGSSSVTQSVWIFERYKDTEYYYITNKYSGKALRAYNTNDMFCAQINKQEKTDAFLWKIKSSTNGAVQIINKATNRYITVNSGIDANNSRILAWSYLGTQQENWMLESVSKKSYPNRYAIQGLSSIYINSINPIRENYTFLGWNTEKDGSGTTYKAENLYNYTGTKNVTLYAQWKSKTYTNTLRYDANGGTGAPITQTEKVTYPNTASKFTVSNVKPTKPGYTFTGWYTAANGGSKVGTQYTVGSNNQEKNQSATLYAHWTANTYTVIYNGNKPSSASNNVTGSTPTSTHYYGQAKKLTKNGFGLKGWTFIGWSITNNENSVPKYDDEESVIDLTDQNNGVVYLYAQWEPGEYNIVYKPNGSNECSELNQTRFFDMEYKLHSNSNNRFVRTGYKLTGWNTKADLSGKHYNLGEKYKNLADPGQSKILYAEWTPNNYNLRIDPNGGYRVADGSTSVITVQKDYDSTEDISERRRTGYTLTGYIMNNSNNGSTTDLGGATFTFNSSSKTGVFKQGTVPITLTAQWTANKYTNTLKYDANGGSGAPASQTASVTYPNTASKFTVSNVKPSRTGYTFIGWYTAANGGTKVEITYTVGSNNQAKNQSATLYAHWSANKYTNTLSYDANGGSGAPASQTATVTYPNTASKFTVSNVKPSRTGYTFIGWYTAANGGSKVGTTYIVGKDNQEKNQSATLYAHWKANTYIVTLQPSGGSLNVEDGSITKNSDGSATFKVTYDTTNYYNLGITASKTGYQVNGFYDNTLGGKKLWDNGGACLNDGTYWLNNKWHYAGDVTLYVQWTANTYTIKYDGNGATGGSTASSNHTYDSAKTLTPNGFVKTGYTFNGWNTQANGKGTSYPNKAYVKNLTAVNNSTVTLYAQWKANTYTVTYNSNKPVNASTTISGTMSKDTATYDQNYTTRANGFKLPGYTFVGWNEKADGTGTDWTGYINKPWRWTYTKNVTLYAQWKANTYTVTYDSNKPANASTTISGTMPTDTATFDQNYTTRANGFTLSGYTFAGWNEKADGTGTDWTGYINKPWRWTYTKNVTLYAQWKANTYTIKLDGNGNTSGTMSNINATFDKDIKLPASTFRKTEYHFIGWSTTKNGEVKYKDGATIKNLTPEQGKTVTLYAVWKELPKAKGVDIAIIKDDGVKMINNNTLESFVRTELQLTIANNEDNITLQSYKILNLDEIKSKINNTESQSEIEIKVEVTYSTGDKSYKVINKDGTPCKLKVLTLVLGDSEQTYTRYIEDDGTLKANSSWRTTTKKTLLEEALNKDLDSIPSKDITK